MEVLDTERVDFAAIPGQRALELKVAETEPWLEGIQGFLIVGGPVLWILFGLSIAAVSIILIKFWQFARLRLEHNRDVHSSLLLWHKGEHEKAQQVLNTRHPVSDVTALAMQEVLAPSTDRELLKENIDRVATLHLVRLRALLPPLEGIATLSPLLGLLGTVLGMILAFQQMETAGTQVDPSVLSSGIWRALLTTAMGLGIAIPVMAIHGWMERKIERVAMQMNNVVIQVFTAMEKRRLTIKED